VSESATTRSCRDDKTKLLNLLTLRAIHRSDAAHRTQSRPPEIPSPAGIRPLPCHPHPGEHFLMVPYFSSTPYAAHSCPPMPRSPVIWPPQAAVCRSTVCHHPKSSHLPFISHAGEHTIAIPSIFSVCFVFHSSP
jgi:hypothetical protein